MADPLANAIEELAGSPNFSVERRASVGKRVFRVQEADVPEFILEVLPDPFILGGRLVQPRSATYPGQPWLTAYKVDADPWDPQNPIGDGVYPARYASWRVTVSYKTFERNESPTDQHKDGPSGTGPPEGQGQTFMTHRVDVGGEFLTLPNAGLQWVLPSDPMFDPVKFPNGPPPQLLAVSTEQQVGITVPILEHAITWHFVPFPPWLTIRQAIGKVNAFTFAGCPPECALFNGLSAQRELTGTGFRTWSMTYKFSEKNNNALNPVMPYGWNYFPRTEGLSAGQFMRMVRRVPGGFAKLSKAMDGSGQAMTVQSPVGFPQSGNYYVRVDGEEMLITGGWGTNNWIASRAQNGTAAAGHSVGAVVYQITRTQLAGGVGASDLTIGVVDHAGFPLFTQFLIQVDQELMAVIAGQGTNTWTVLRGVTGTTAAAHGGGVSVTAANSPIYDLYDHNLLFLSGLIVG